MTSLRDALATGAGSAGRGGRKERGAQSESPTDHASAINSLWRRRAPLSPERSRSSVTDATLCADAGQYGALTTIHRSVRKQIVVRLEVHDGPRHCECEQRIQDKGVD